MGSTYLSLTYHLVFGTKHRESLIGKTWRPQLHEYLGGTIRGLGGTALEVGGVADHVHLLVGLKATHRLADVLRELKKASTAWVHSTIRERGFRWQDGYSAFTVSATSRSAVRRYIANQAEHHQRKSFRDEMIEMFRKAGIEFDEQFLG